MSKTERHSNNIKDLLKQKDMNARELAEKIGTSAPHMSRLINGESPLHTKWLLKISGVLKVPTNKIVGVEMGKKFSKNHDDTLLGSIMGWLYESSDDAGVKLSRQEMAKLTSFIYKVSEEEKLPYDETYNLVLRTIQIKKLLEK